MQNPLPSTFEALTIQAFATSPAECRAWLADCVEMVLPLCPELELVSAVDMLRAPVAAIPLGRVAFSAQVIANRQRRGSVALSAADAVAWACCSTPRNMAHGLFHALVAKEKAGGEAARAEMAARYRALWTQRFETAPAMRVPA